MSELKVYKISGIEFDSQFYHKSEADKVIAEKDKELRHQKYKRCLAMAKACHEKGERMYCEASVAKAQNEIIGKEPKDAVVKKFELWGAIASTHRKRWLKLAEQFKPNN